MSEHAPPTTPGHDPKQLGPYVIEGRIATGAVSVIYVARHEDTGDTVALKVLHPQVTSNRRVKARFRRVAEALVGQPLPHVVPLLDYVEKGPASYFVFNHIDGKDLGQVTTKGGTLRTATALRYLVQVATGLRAAYARGLLHGDTRPGHILVGGGSAFITGFSLSVSWRSAHGRPVMGDPAYLAPELARGEKPDIRSDIYALGCTVYEFLAGRPPFGVLPPDALMACHAHEPFPNVRALSTAVPDEAAQMLMRMAAKNRARRIQTYDDLIERTTQIIKGLGPITAEAPSLTVESGRQRGQKFDITQDAFLLGRTPGEGIFIDDGRISRRHAMIVREGRYLTVNDLGSRNGIKVNGARIDTQKLAPGDRIGLGDTVLRIIDCDPPREEAPSMEGDPLPASPVRGAFGGAEVVRPPKRQLTLETLSVARTDVPAVRALSKLCVHLLEGHLDAARLTEAAVTAASFGTGADDGMLVGIENRGGEDTPTLAANSAQQAELLSVVLPAVSRALPGRMSVLTHVRHDRDDTWSTILAPVMRRDRVVAYLVLVSRDDTFSELDLEAVELVADLLTKRHGMGDATDTVVIPFMRSLSDKTGTVPRPLSLPDGDVVD